jgi:hypothetical protein
VTVAFDSRWERGTTLSFRWYRQTVEHNDWHIFSSRGSEYRIEIHDITRGLAGIKLEVTATKFGFKPITVFSEALVPAIPSSHR